MLVWHSVVLNKPAPYWYLSATFSGTSLLQTMPQLDGSFCFSSAASCWLTNPTVESPKSLREPRCHRYDANAAVLHVEGATKRV